MSTFENRLARVEARCSPAAALPVVLDDECDRVVDHIGQRIILRSRDGTSWAQPAGESIEAFKGRVTAEASHGIRTPRGDTAVRLVVLPALMSREAWLEKYGHLT